MKEFLTAILEVFCALLGLAFAIAVLGSVIYGNQGFVDLLASFIS